MNEKLTTSQSPTATSGIATSSAITEVIKTRTFGPTTASGNSLENVPVAVDFETYYDDECSVQELGVVAYCAHPKFEAYLVSVYDGTYQFVGHPKDFDWASISGRDWLAHNAQFDRGVYESLQKKFGTGTSNIQKTYGPSRWVDTAAMVAYLQFGRALKDVVNRLYGVALRKEVRSDAKGKTWDDMLTDGSAKAMLDYAGEDAYWCWKLYMDHSPRWPRWEQDVSELTIECGLKGVNIDEEKVHAEIKILERARWEAENEIPWVKEGDKPTSPKALRRECEKSGIPAPESLAEDSVECEQWEETYGETYPWVADMRLWRKANLLLKKYQRLRDRLVDGVFSYSLKYCGAPHTKRFAGEAGFNMQNLHKKPLIYKCDGVEHTIDIRSKFIPRARYRMVVADWEQIEARILAWIAGQNDILELVRKGISVYEAHARATMGWKGGVLKDENPSLYALAKARVLGLGYGCGHIRFVEAARVLAKYVISLQDSKKTVYEYRDANFKIVKLWNKLINDCQSTLTESLKIHPEFKVPTPMRVFTCELPSGNCIHYFNVRKTKSPTKIIQEKNAAGVMEQKNIGDKIEIYGEVEYGANGRMSKKLYGGLLTENLVQGIARDVLCDRMLELRRQIPELNILFHVHDEIVFELPEEIDPGRAISIMSTAPDWAPGLPLGVDWKIVKGYTK